MLFVFGTILRCGYFATVKVSGCTAGFSFQHELFSTTLPTSLSDSEAAVWVFTSVLPANGVDGELLEETSFDEGLKPTCITFWWRTPSV